MFEKVNPMHPDKVADRIAGALVDLAYSQAKDPKIAVEVLIGHGKAHIIAETSEKLDPKKVAAIVTRISGISVIDYVEVPQDPYLAQNQEGKMRCGDNGIFKGWPITKEQTLLTDIAKDLYNWFGSDGKYLIAGNEITICQSNCSEESQILPALDRCPSYWSSINPLGPWTGGLNVDCGATNRKLGSDMGDAVTGGGLHGKDLSKADVTLNIYCHLKAQSLKIPFELSCSIGDDIADGRPYAEIVEIAREYINELGGFEKFAEWGLIR